MSTYKTTTVEKNDMNAQRKELRLTQAFWAGRRFAKDEMKAGNTDELIDTLLERLDAHSELQAMDAGIIDAVKEGCACEMHLAMINKALESK